METEQSVEKPSKLGCILFATEEQKVKVLEGFITQRKEKAVKAG